MSLLILPQSLQSSQASLIILLPTKQCYAKHLNKEQAVVSILIWFGFRCCSTIWTHSKQSQTRSKHSLDQKLAGLSCHLLPPGKFLWFTFLSRVFHLGWTRFCELGIVVTLSASVNHWPRTGHLKKHFYYTDKVYTACSLSLLLSMLFRDLLTRLCMLHPLYLFAYYTDSRSIQIVYRNLVTLHTCCNCQWRL